MRNIKLNIQTSFGTDNQIIKNRLEVHKNNASLENQ